LPRSEPPARIPVLGAPGPSHLGTWEDSNRGVIGGSP
jgi:hypothetical protein